MAHVTTELDTAASPESVMRALTDFGPRRFELWPNVDSKYFKLESLSEESAEVTEGSPVFGGVWERGRYDWSRPGSVRIEVKDSNAFAPGSSWLYQVSERPGGGSHVHMEFDRRPRNLKGLLLSGVLSLVGKKMYTQQLGETLRRVEKADGRSRPGGVV